MQALVKNADQPGMSMADVPVPEPAPDEVRLAVKSVGIDGGVELLVYDEGDGWENMAPALPRVYGHEFAGVVDEVGSAVTRFSTGDRVAVEPGITCGTCLQCRSGQPNICVDRTLIGVDLDGALAEYVNVPAGNVYPIDSNLSFDEAAYLQPLALGVNALEYSALEPGDSVAITGPGPVGLAVLTACRAAGADPITVVGAPVDAEKRLPIASQMGADRTQVGGDPLRQQVDVFFEVSGNPNALEMAIENTRRGGQIVQVGLFHGNDVVAADLNHLVLNGIGYRPIRARRDSSWRRAVSIAGYTDLEPIVGPGFDLHEHEEAFTAARNRDGVKVLLRP